MSSKKNNVSATLWIVLESRRLKLLWTWMSWNNSLISVFLEMIAACWVHYHCLSVLLICLMECCSDCSPYPWMSLKYSLLSLVPEMITACWVYYHFLSVLLSCLMEYWFDCSPLPWICIDKTMWLKFKSNYRKV